MKKYTMFFLIQGIITYLLYIVVNAEAGIVTAITISCLWALIMFTMYKIMEITILILRVFKAHQEIIDEINTNINEMTEELDKAREILNGQS